MAIEDHLHQPKGLKISIPSSRVRRRLEALSQDLQGASLATVQFVVANGPRLSTAQVIAELAEAQAEWTRLDDLRTEARKQQERIATRAAAIMEFVVHIRMHVRNLERKPRRKLTSEEKVLAAAKLRETRRLRGQAPEEEHQGLAMSRVLAIAGLMALLPGRALAWGTEGHQIVATLAQAHLTPAAAAAVHELLGAETMADVALWADAIKASARPETRPWHYVLIPDKSPAFDDQRDCAGRNCVVDKIVDFEAVLKDPRTKREQGVEALKFLIHYVADLHQPIHCEDRGDNLSHGLAVTYPKLGRTDFHVVWDTGVVQTDMAARGARDVATYAAILDAQSTASRAAWSVGTPADWATESHHVAQKIYAELGRPAPGTTLNLTAAYGIEHSAVLEGQLERAGVRLAAILNEVLEATSR